MVGGDGRAGRLLMVAVAGLEAVAVAAAGVAAAVSGLREGSAALGAGVAAAAVLLAYLLVEIARGLAKGRRWPVGVFVTIQLLTGLVALSVGAPALLAIGASSRIGGLTLAALVVAAAGLSGAVLLGFGRGSSPSGRDESSPHEAG